LNDSGSRQELLVRESGIVARGGILDPMSSTTPPRRGSYGIDAPLLVPIPIFLAAANIVLGIVSRSIWPYLGAAAWLCMMGFALHASKRGKFIVWERVLDSLALRGDERILDLGCGRGAVLLAVARRLPEGHAVGVDVWHKTDQSGNAADATRFNAIAEGVSERVTLVTGDARSLPFPNDHFDVIVSSLALHNINGASERDRAIDEAVRVLKPGGRLLIADLWGTRDYLRRLNELSMTHLNRRGLGWHVWWGGPWATTRMVEATKPGEI